MLALWLERRFSKDQILSLYLNRVYLGAGTYGVEAASERYFKKTASDVTLAEAALLAGLLKAPSRYAPTRNSTRAQERAETVLTKMVEAGFITPAERWRAKQTPPRFARSGADDSVHYFVDWVVDRIPDYIGETEADLIVDTTLDRDLQIKAEKALRLTLERDGKTLGFSQASLVSLDTVGAVQAMVGGGSYRKSQFNRVVHAKRQPGSAFKPIIYLTGLEQGLSPQSMVEDAPVRIGSWAPKNFTDRYRGMITLTEALAQSVNTAAVRMAEQAGRNNILSTAQRLGIASPLTRTPSLALGVSEVNLLELVGAYAPFANGGMGVLPHGIIRIRTKDGTLLYERYGSGLGRVVSPSHVADMNHMLGQVMQAGTGRKAQLPDRPAAGKTGTSQGNRDAWFVGYTADLITGVWVGNDDFTPMGRVTGGRVPTVIWKDFMLAAHRDWPIRPLPDERSGMAVASGPNNEERGAFSRFFSRIFGY